MPVQSLLSVCAHLYCSAFCEVDQCPLRTRLTPPELKSFSSLTGFQTAPRDAGQFLRQGSLNWPPFTQCCCLYIPFPSFSLTFIPLLFFYCLFFSLSWWSPPLLLSSATVLLDLILSLHIFRLSKTGTRAKNV